MKLPSFFSRNEHEQQLAERERQLAEREGLVEGRERALDELSHDQNTRAEALLRTLDAVRNRFEAQLAQLQQSFGQALSGTCDSHATALKTAQNNQAETFRTSLTAEANAFQMTLDQVGRDFGTQLNAVVQGAREALSAERQRLEEERVRLGKQEEELGRRQGQVDAAAAANERIREQNEAERHQLDQDRASLETRKSECIRECEARRAACQREIEAHHAGMKQTIEDLLSKRYGDLQDQCDALQRENDDLRVQGNRALARVRDYQNLQAILDEHHWEASEIGNIIFRLENQITEECQRLENEKEEAISDRDATIEQLNRELRDARERCQQAESDACETYRLQKELLKAHGEASRAQQELEGAKAKADSMLSELNRLKVKPDENKPERILAIESQKNPVVERKNDPLPVEGREAYAPSELTWLDGIEGKCKEYGIVFPRRLLRSFHTALKTAEMSPLTVLAGVSGTGKSLLPKLYAHFGGLYFHSVAVQPNWDGKESLLGYFNSIDNRFKPESTLRFLAQASKECDEAHPHGLRDRVCLALLDEMNLAHPELYFADFLSKLEERRESIEGKEPELDVDIGTGCDPYGLRLGRNVLWTGTMNQDETTKALSDKVIDRSMMLFFPRPRTLVDLKTRALDESNRGKPLPYDVWKSWKDNPATIKQETMDRYRWLLEDINERLATQGRAIGHRVWQSVELYMRLHPEVLHTAHNPDGEDFKKALDNAFEDQIVLKVMPKLRGLESSDSSKSRKECLNPIREKLREPCPALDTDFERAMNVGDGQFVWQSAEYLNPNT